MSSVSAPQPGRLDSTSVTLLDALQYWVGSVPGQVVYRAAARNQFEVCEIFAAPDPRVTLISEFLSFASDRGYGVSFCRSDDALLARKLGFSAPVSHSEETEPGTAERASVAELHEQLFDSVASIDAEAWETIRDPDAIFLDLRLLRALELSMADSSRFRFVIYRDLAGEPLAIAVLCTFKVDVGVLANDWFTRWALKQLGKISRWLVDYKILFCGLPLSACQSSLAFAPQADSAAILRQMDLTMRRLAKQDGAHVIVFKEFADDEMPPLKSLESSGYRRADSLPTHHVHLHSSTFEGYLQDVGKKKRHHIRQSMSKFARSGIEIITTSDLPTIERLFTTATHRLYEAVLSRSATQLEHLPSEFFLELARHLPDCCEFQFAVQQDVVVGFCISLKTGACYRALFVGLDYGINRDVDLYFNLLFRTVADGLAAGASSVEIGQNSDYFKRTKLGSQQSRRSVYVRGRGALMNAVIGLLFHQLFPARPLLEDSKSQEPVSV